MQIQQMGCISFHLISKSKATIGERVFSGFNEDDGVLSFGVQ